MQEKLRLHELTDLALDVERQLDQLAELDDPAVRDEAMKAALSVIEGDIQQTATGLAALVLNREADAARLAHDGELLNERAVAILKRSTAIQHGADRLRDYIAGCLAALGTDTQKISPNGLIAITLSKESAPKLHVMDAAELPREYRVDVLEVPAPDVPVALVKYTTGHKPNRRELDALKATGVEDCPPGTELRVPTRRLLLR